MLNRHAITQLEQWKQNKTTQGLLVMGARQVGKTTLIRQFAHTHYKNIAEINFYDNTNAKDTLNAATNTKDLLMRLSVLTGTKIIPSNTLLFLDEIQECQDALTWVKFLAGENNLDVIVSGSLLGLDAFVNTRSFPVGFLQTITMYPLNFLEFCEATGLNSDTWNEVRKCVLTGEQIPEYLHDAYSKQFMEYLLIGGMPAAVQTFVDSYQIIRPRQIQHDISQLYSADITKYVENKLEARQIKMVLDAIPSQLNSPTKRFKYARLNKNLRFANLETAFDWLVHAGIAIQVTKVSEIAYPLALSEDITSFKFFLNDIGLLTQTLLGDADINIINGKTNINYGSLYEAFVAQELFATGITPHYYSSKKHGEIDFVAENKQTGNVLPIEVKSGKDYKRHSALSNYLASCEVAAGTAREMAGNVVREVVAGAGRSEQALILHNGNVEVSENKLYAPAYTACLAKDFL